MTTRHGGIALMLGVVIFLLSRFRHLVDMPDAGLWLLIPVGFVLWLVGLIALRSHYGPRTRRVGRFGLLLTLVGVGLLAVGHLGLLVHLSGAGPQALREIVQISFIPIVLGTFVLTVGVLAFGIDAVRGGVLPRLKAAPLVTGLLGLAWMFFAFDSRPVEGNPEAFLAMRTAFGLGWLLVATVLATDSGAERTEPATTGERRTPL